MRTRPVFDINRYYSTPVFLEPQPNLFKCKLVHCRTTSSLATVRSPTKTLGKLTKLSRLSPILILKEVYSKKPKIHRGRSKHAFDE
jgi:hypothetical protein